MLQILLSFVVNFIIAVIFYTLYALFFPVGGPMLAQLLTKAGVPYTIDAVILVNAALTVAVAGLLGVLPFMQGTMARAYGARKPRPEERPVLEAAMGRICAASGGDEDDYKLRVRDDPTLNAFALGRDMITVHTGLLQLPFDQLTGIMAHEVGHIENGDTRVGLVTYGMNLVGTLMVRILVWVQRIVALLSFIPLAGWVAGIVSWVLFGIITFINLLLHMPQFLVTQFLSRQHEYAADRFACELGFGVGLHNGLLTISQGEQKMGFFSRLASSHPATAARLQRIRTYVEGAA